MILEALALSSRLTFEPVKHTYALDGVSLPSVTTILKTLDKPALVPWASKIQAEADFEAVDTWLARGMPGSLESALKPASQAWRKKRDKAGDAGTQAHALIEHASRLMLGLQSEEPDVSDEARYIFSGWQLWATSVGYKPIAVEARIFHPHRHYAGNIDVIAEFPGLAIEGPVVADWKSSAKGALYDEHKLQSIAYRMAFGAMCQEIEPGAQALPGIVVALPKETAAPIKVHEIPLDLAAWDAFLGALAVYRWKAA